VDETGLGSCPVTGFGISNIEPSGSTNRGLKLWEITDGCFLGCSAV
jgi:hypothetical protein